MKGPAGIDIPNRRARIYGTGENPLCWTPLPTMALAAANMLRNPDPVLNRPIYISPFVSSPVSTPYSPLTQNSLLKAVESVLGTPFQVENVDVATINKNAKIALERGDVATAMKGLTVGSQFYEADSGNDFSALVENEVVGVHMCTIEDAVRDAISRYGQHTPVIEAMYKVEPCSI